MKYSNYNSIISISEKHRILYNAMSDKFVILKEKAAEDYNKYDADVLYNRNLTLYNQLVGVGAIIEDSADEKDQVSALIKQTDDNDTTYYLHVNPTIDCNFRCWYCYENHVKGSKMSPDVIESVKRLMDNTIKYQPNLQTFILSFFGGEPLMYFNTIARPLIDHIETACASKGINVSIHFTSNGYLLTDKMIEYFRKKDICFQITLDGAREDHNQTRFTNKRQGSYDQIISNIKKLAEIGARIILRINYTSSNIFNASKIQHDLEDLDAAYRNKIDIDFQRVWQDINAEDDEKIVEIVNENVKTFTTKGYKVSSHKTLDSVRNSCYGDKRYHALVNFNGDVFNCTARDFLSKNRTGYLRRDGLIIWEDDSLEKRMTMKFSKPVCHTCRIAPLCGGGCAQRALEGASDDSCLYFYSDKDIDQIILDRFEYMFLTRMSR